MELFKALYDEDKETALKLIDTIGDINQLNKEGNTFLIQACEHFSWEPEIIFKLIDKGINLNVKNKRGYTAFLYLCKTWSSENKNPIIDKLIDLGCDLNITDQGKDTPLIHSVLFRNDEITYKLLDKDADVNLLSNGDWSALAIACFHKNEDLAIKILNKCDLSYLEKGKGPRTSAIQSIYKNKLTKVHNHLKLIFRNTFLENIDNQNTTISKCFTNPIADLNVIDLIVESIY